MNETRLLTRRPQIDGEALNEALYEAMDSHIDLDEIELKVKSDPRYLVVIRTVAVLAAEQAGFDVHDVEDVKLAVDEACSNVIRHAYKGDREKDIKITFKSGGGWFHVFVEDNGAKAEAGCLRERCIDEVRPGGLGLHFMKKAFQIIMFDGEKIAGNRLILGKQLLGEKDGH